MTEPVNGAREIVPYMHTLTGGGMKNFGPQKFEGENPPPFMSSMSEEEEPTWGDEGETPIPPTEVSDPKTLAFEP